MTSDPVTNRAARWVPSSGRLAPGTIAHAPIRDTAKFPARRVPAPALRPGFGLAAVGVHPVTRLAWIRNAPACAA